MERAEHDLDAGAAVSLLDWWVEAGVDTLVADLPRDWLVPAPAAPAGARANASAPPLPDAPAGPKQALPDQLPLFHEWLKTSDALPYATPGAPRVCPAGDPAAGLTIMAAMPSTADCAAGTLLSGAAGRLFDRMLHAIGRDRDTIYLAGLSCLRPAGGRFDTADDERCAEIARHHLGLVGPRAVLLFGDACARVLVGGGVLETRGQVHRIGAGADAINAIVTFHPEHLLAQPAAKALAWADLLLLMEQL